jgi:hypothetical protein
MDNPFPLYVRLDDGELIRIESIDKVLYHLEAIDIENNEYLFWDAAGNGVKILLAERVGWFKSPNVSGVRPAENRISFSNSSTGVGKPIRHSAGHYRNSPTDLGQTTRKRQFYE